jgi:hypothetical protein
MALSLPIADYLEIQQLYARYAVSFDLHDPETWLACYTEDGSLEWGEGGEKIGWPPTATTGKKALRALAARSMSLNSRKGYHWNANLVIDATPEGAHGQCYLLFLLSPNGLGEPSIAAHYSDQLVKQDGEWLFKRRIIQFLPDPS